LENVIVVILLTLLQMLICVFLRNTFAETNSYHNANKQCLHRFDMSRTCKLCNSWLGHQLFRVRVRCWKLHDFVLLCVI